MENNAKKDRVRRVLAHSHSAYFILFLLGVALDLIFNLEIFTSLIAVPIGLLLLVSGTLLILWAEKTPHNFKDGNFSKESFYVGPYRFTRNPTHLGLFFLVIGFGFIANAFFVVLSALVSFLVEKFIFQEKVERILETKYGTHYIEYKKSVKF